MASAVLDRTLFVLCLASDLLPHGETFEMTCEACWGESGALSLLVGRCSNCGGLLVCCDNATCPYTLECACELDTAVRG